MSLTILNPDEAAALEARYANLLGAQALMSRAGAAAARLVASRIKAGGVVTVLAGTGGNGGDAYATALELKRAGYTVHVVAPGGKKPTHEAGAYFHEEWVRQGGVVEADPYMTPKADCIVDGLLGSAQNRPVTGDMLDAVLWFNERRCFKLALDMPTGIHPQTGARLGACPGARADVTLAFLSTKPGLYMLDGADAAGEIVVDELGVSIPLTNLAVVTPEDFEHVTQKRLRHAHKGDFGRVRIIGAARGKIGAGLLAARAAMRLGAGRVTLECLSESAPEVDALMPEIMFDVETPLSAYDVLVIGPGLGQDERALARLEAALEVQAPLVLDADALNLTAGHMALQDKLLGRRYPTVLTPHAMEAARLLRRDVGAVESDRVAAARELAVQTGAIVVLKGPGSVVALRSGRTWINPTGNAMLASAGTGDVLAGMIGAFFAQGFDMVASTLAGVWLHGVSAHAREAGFTASDVAPRAAQILESMRRRTE